MRELVVILAGGAGSRMEVLTEHRAKPALPFAGVYRLIDFPLSNCLHSRLSDVWVIEQYEALSLTDHLANGRPWDLDRTHGGLRLLGPQQGPTESGWHLGNADALTKIRPFIREFDPDVLLVLSADHVYKLDYREVLAAHQDRGADLTMVTTVVPQEEASRFGTVSVGDDGRVTGFDYKPERPVTGLVSTEIFVYRPQSLLSTLDRLAAREGADDDLPEDYGVSLLPAIVEEGRAYEHRLGGYWQDLGTVQSYWQAHMDLLAPEPPLELDDPGWPIHTQALPRPPAQVHGQTNVEDCLLSPGCDVAGRVVSSVLGPGTVVEPGAVVRNSVLFDDCTVASGATVDTAIVDSGAHIGSRAKLGKFGRRASDVTLVGRGASVPARARVAAGARVPPAEQYEPRH